MALVLRRSVPLALVAIGAVWAAWLGFHPQTFGDYPGDYAPAMNALLSGHITTFLTHLPTNGAGGSVLLRAPAALIGKLLVGGQAAIFRFGALECMLVTGALGLFLAARIPARRRPMLANVAIVALCVLSPALLDAIRFGHPEEPLGAALCVGAVLLAGDGRGGLAGAALGLAVINKPWGVLAVLPALLAAPPAARVRLVSVAGTIAAAWIGAAYVASSAHFTRILLGASDSVVAHPVDLWWPLANLHAPTGVTPAYFPPAFVTDHARSIAVLLAIPLAMPLVRKGGRNLEASLALLALMLLLRCMLDPSNHVYYQVPFVIALTAWEARTRGAPVLAMIATGGFFLIFHTISGTGSLYAQYLGYVVLTVPLAVTLAGPASGRAPDELPPDPRVAPSVSCPG